MPVAAARVSTAWVFLIHAAAFGGLAPRIPTLKDELALSEADLGIAFVGLSAGLFAGTRVVAPVLRRLGSRTSIRAALVVLCGALLGPALAGGLASLTLAFAVLGAVGGFIDVAMNAHAVEVERAYGRSVLGGLHGVWSLGLLAGGAAGALAAEFDASLELHFGLVAGVLLLATSLALGGLLPAAPDAHRPAAEVGPPRWALASPAVLLLGLVALSSFVGEGAAADWSAVYLSDRVGAGPGLAGAAFVAFALGMAAARFAADRLADRLGAAAVVRASALVAAAGLTLALAVPRPATGLVGFALLGIGLAPVAPLVFSAAGNANVRDQAAALGWVVTIGYVGSIAGPAAIGFTAEEIGLRGALLIPVVLALVIAAAAHSLRRNG